MSRRLWAAAMGLVLLVAFALRVGWLDRLPLWWDEGLSAYLSHHDPLTLLNEMQASEHADPPAYPLALSVWHALAGGSPFSLRFFSVWMSTLAIALTWAAGRWLADKKVALLGALFVALAPMQVYYAREAKSYAFAMACALLSTYAWGSKLGYHAVSSNTSPGWWIVYVLSTAAAVGSHYYLAPLVLWQGSWVAAEAAQAVLHRTPSRRAAFVRLARWALAAAAIALLLAPAAIFLYNTTVQGVVKASTSTPLPLWTYLGTIALDFGAGVDERGFPAIVAAAGLIVFAIAGALNGRERRFMLAWIGIPLAAAFLLQTQFSFFFPRFLLYIGPALALLVAQGIATFGRRQWPALSTVAAVAITGVALVLWAPGLVRVYTRPADSAENPIPSIAYLRAHSQPGDALIYVYIWQAGYIHSHYPEHDLTLYRAHHTPETVAQALTDIAAQHTRLWLYSYRIAPADPHNLPASWLEVEAYRAGNAWYGDHNLALYISPTFATAGVGPAEGTARFDDRIELRYPRIDAHLHPGDIVAVPLQWQALTALETDYKVFVHLGMPDAPPVAQSDSQPQDGRAPTSAWEAGQTIVDRRALLLPDDMPPGRYPVLAGLYDPVNGTRLSANGAESADRVLLGYVEVVP